MPDTPWDGDACSLVDAFRRGDRSPVEEMDATLAAIERSDLNCFSHVDGDRARDAAGTADVSLPFGGVPAGIKELEPVAGWPFSEGSLVFRDRVADHTSTMVERFTSRGGAVPVGQTTASEFGGLNVSVTKVHGVTHNPWRHGRTAGGSSGGSASAVAGGLVTIATGGDGGGSIRIPAGYNGLLGMKGTYGRIPRGPHAYIRPSTVVLGCLARSVRDVARYYDVCAGYDTHDPTSLPAAAPGAWESGLGSSLESLRGRRVAVDVGLGGVPVTPQVEASVNAAADALVADLGLVRVDRDVRLPNLAAQWMMGNLATLLADLGSRWPACRGELTDEVAVGLLLAQSLYNLHTAAVAETQRVEANEVMASLFDDVDLVIAATNPDPAFPAEAAMSSSESSFIDWAKSNEVAKLGFRGVMGLTRVGAGVAPKLPNALLDFTSSKFPDLVNMGALTIVSNLCGNPAVSIPVATADGLPVGMQVLARHHADELLFDVALAVERARPWPLVAPAATVGVG